MFIFLIFVFATKIIYSSSFTFNFMDYEHLSQLMENKKIISIPNYFIKNEIYSDLLMKIAVIFFSDSQDMLEMIIVRLDNVLENHNENLSHSLLDSDLLWKDCPGWIGELDINGIIIPSNEFNDSMYFDLNLKDHHHHHIANSLYRTFTMEEESFTKEIPPLIHQITSNSPLEKSMLVVEKLIKITKIMNPHYIHCQYSIQGLEDLIFQLEGQEVLDSYKILGPMAFKADLARYVLLKHYGGIYMDSKLHPLYDLNYILPNTGHLLLNGAKMNSVQNSFMAFPKGDPIFREIISLIVLNCRERSLKDSPYAITGSYLLQRVMGSNSFRKNFILEKDLYISDIRSASKMIVFHNAEYRRQQSLLGEEHYLRRWERGLVFN